MADPDQRTEGEPPKHVHIGPEHHEKGTNWLAWLALLAGILALLFALSRCDRDEDAVVTNTTTTTAVTNTTAAAPDAVVAATPTAGTAAMADFLAGTEPTPRTFQFEKLNFDTGKSDVRAADAAEVNAVAATLQRYPQTRIRIAGYADARGSDPANMALGKSRADAIKTALVAKGIDAGRVETTSGGENDPVASNATAGGQFENRRTELVVTAR